METYLLQGINGPCSCGGGLYRVNHMKKVFNKKEKERWLFPEVKCLI
jgi:hypothetical protein